MVAGVVSHGYSLVAGGQVYKSIGKGATPLEVEKNDRTRWDGPDGSFGHESGMAAPTVSALLSFELTDENAEISSAIQRLMERAEDPVFEYGLLQ